jgi:hypothetical protein
MRYARQFIFNGVYYFNFVSMFYGAGIGRAREIEFGNYHAIEAFTYRATSMLMTECEWADIQFE